MSQRWSVVLAKSRAAFTASYRGARPREATLGGVNSAEASNSSHNGSSTAEPPVIMCGTSDVSAARGTPARVSRERASARAPWSTPLPSDARADSRADGWAPYARAESRAEVRFAWSHGHASQLGGGRLWLL